MKSIAFVANKGGQAKTATAVHVAAGIAQRGNRVLLVDVDNQATASYHLGVDAADLLPSSADVLVGEMGIEEEGVIRETSTPGLHLVTGSMELADVDLVLGQEEDRLDRLKNAIKPIARKYDSLICDTPPSLGLSLVNALVASDFFAICCRPEPASVKGLVHTLEAIDRLRKGTGLKARSLGVLLTVVDRRTKVTEDMIKSVRKELGHSVLKSEIPVNASMSRAFAEGKTIYQYDKSATAAIAYEKLTKEILSRCRNRKGK